MSDDTTSRAWDEHADAYARIASPCTGYIAQTLFAHVAARLPPAPEILDVACGNGELAQAAVHHVVHEAMASGRPGRVVATDVSAAMIDRTRRRLLAVARDDLFACTVADGQALPFETASFDAVCSAFGIFLFPDRAAGWAEAARVLRPGGLLGTAVWRGPEVNELARAQMQPVLDALPPRILRGMPRADWLDITTADGLRDEICRFGFEDPEIVVFDAVLTAPSAGAMWSMMLDNPVAATMLRGCSAEERSAVERSAVASFEARAGGPDRPVRFGASCHLLVARRR